MSTSPTRQCVHYIDIHYVDIPYDDEFTAENWLPAVFTTDLRWNWSFLLIL